MICLDRSPARKSDVSIVEYGQYVGWPANETSFVLGLDRGPAFPAAAAIKCMGVIYFTFSNLHTLQKKKLRQMQKGLKELASKLLVHSTLNKIY